LIKIKSFVKRSTKIAIKGKLTFPGGIHPPENKYFTEDKNIQILPTPRQVAILLSQHIGAPCKPVVAKRDKVSVGDVVGDCDAFVSAPVHSSVNGTVKDIALQSHPVVGRVEAVIIETDPESESTKKPCSEQFSSDFDDSKYTPEQICDASRKAGIV